MINEGRILCGVAWFIAGIVCILVSIAFLRAGCWLYNRIAGYLKSPKVVPEPSFKKGMLIVLVTGIYFFVLSLTLRFFFPEGVNMDVGTLRYKTCLVVQALTILISILAPALALSRILPTRYWRAVIVIILCYSIFVIPFVLIYYLGGLPMRAPNPDTPIDLSK